LVLCTPEPEEGIHGIQQVRVDDFIGICQPPAHVRWHITAINGQPLHSPQVKQAVLPVSAITVLKAVLPYCGYSVNNNQSFENHPPVNDIRRIDSIPENAFNCRRNRLKMGAGGTIKVNGCPFGLIEKNLLT